MKNIILQHWAGALDELTTRSTANIANYAKTIGVEYQMKNRGTTGVFEKTWITEANERQIPDGLAGNSAYIIKPWAAQELIDKYHEVGVWPNDALMCKQLFPYLEEYFPFVTKVNQTQSTTVA